MPLPLIGRHLRSEGASLSQVVTIASTNMRFIGAAFDHTSPRRRISYPTSNGSSAFAWRWANHRGWVAYPLPGFVQSCWSQRPRHHRISPSSPISHILAKWATTPSRCHGWPSGWTHWRLRMCYNQKWVMPLLGLTLTRLRDYHCPLANFLSPGSITERGNCMVCRNIALSLIHCQWSTERLAQVPDPYITTLHRSM